MANTLSPAELQHLETFFTTCLSDAGSMTHPELLDAIQDNQELCAKVLHQLQKSVEAPTPSPRRLTAENLQFLESWLKARNLVLGGIQLLQLADPDNAASIQHELECTETAFVLLPDLISEAKARL